VEVLVDGVILSGKVRWKGKIPGKQGCWVGLELWTRIGTGNGSLKGIQYFSCPDGYGVFVRSSQLRFPPSKGRSYSSYHKISKESAIDEELFGESRRVTNISDIQKSCHVTSLYAASAGKCFPEKQRMNERQNFHLGHPVSCRFAQNLHKKSGPFSGCGPTLYEDLFASEEGKKTTRKISTGLNASTSAKGSFNNGHSRPLISPPSIPHIHKLTSNAWL